MRDVLVALCGLTPQVVTETLWALGRRRPAVIPCGMWILTTDRGRDLCVNTLLGPRGALAAYGREYGLTNALPQCDPADIVVLRNANGDPLSDVRSQSDHEAIADQLTEFLSRLTQKPDTRLHCSLAGGRKTMGVLLAGALQLCGRAEDRLYHVLISPEFEFHPKFFYPPRRATWLTTDDGKRLDARRAQVELAEVPYVRLRSLLPTAILTGKTTFTDLVERADRELRALTDPDPVTVCARRPFVEVGSAGLRLQPASHRLYAAFARVKTKACSKPERADCGDCTACFLPVSSSDWEETRAKLEELLEPGPGLPADVEGFRALISKVNRALERGLGSTRLAARYGIRSLGERNAKTYGLAVSKERIREENP